MHCSPHTLTFLLKSPAAHTASEMAKDAPDMSFPTFSFAALMSFNKLRKRFVSASAFFFNKSYPADRWQHAGQGGGAWE
jgi:hypothetical protein